MPEINVRLRQAREARGWSQHELARQLGVSWKSISYWENGQRRPQRFHLERLCALFGRMPEELGFEPSRSYKARATLPADPLTIPTPSPMTLPPRLDHFVGRESERETIVHLLEMPTALSPVIAIVGLSGIGKSALGAEVLHHLAARPHSFTRGMSTCACAHKQGMDGLLGVYSLIAETWQVDLTGAARDATQAEVTATCFEARLHAHLHFDNRALMLFDNVESDFPLERLIQTCRTIGLAMLMTSTTYHPSPFITKTHHLGPLSPHDSEMLFAWHYRAMGHTWSADKDRAPTQRLLKRLGYLPLAIRLAATLGHLRALSPAHLAKEIESAHSLRHLRDPTTPQHAMLLLLEKVLAAASFSVGQGFAALGIFADTIIPVQFVRVMFAWILPSHEEHDPLVVLDSMIMASLLKREWDARLAEPVVQIHPLVQTVAQMHWRALDAAQQADGIATLVAELVPYAADHTLHPEALTARSALILGTVRQGFHSLGTSRKVSALAGVMERHLDLTGQWAALRGLLLTHARAARREQRNREEGEALVKLGNLAYFTGKHREAARCYLQATSRTTSMPDIALDSALGVGTIALLTDRLDEAGHCFGRALEAAIGLGDLDRLGRAAVALGDVMARRWRIASALTLYQRALECTRATGDRRTQGYVHMALGHQAYFRGDEIVALAHYTAAHEIALAMHNQLREAYALRGLGYVATRQNRLEDACQHFTRSVAIARAIGNRAGEGDAARNLGDVYTRQGHFTEAAHWLDHSWRIAEELQHRTGKSHTLRLKGYLALRQYHVANACEAFRASLALAEEIGDDGGSGEALLGMAETAFAQHEWRIAYDLYDRAYAIFHRLGYVEATRAKHGMQNAAMKSIVLPQKA